MSKPKRTVILPDALTQAVLRETIDHCVKHDIDVENDIGKAFSSRLAIAVQLNRRLEDGQGIKLPSSPRAHWTEDGRLAVDYFD